MEEKNFKNTEDFVEYTFTDSEFVPDTYFKTKKNLENVLEDNFLDENFNFEKEQELFSNKKTDAFILEKDDFSKISIPKTHENLVFENNPNNDTFEIINKTDINKDEDNLSQDSLELAFSSGNNITNISDEKVIGFESINTFNGNMFEKNDDFEDKFSMLFYKDTKNFQDDQFKQKEILEDIIEENENLNTVSEIEKQIDNEKSGLNKEKEAFVNLEIKENKIIEKPKNDEIIEKEKKVDKIFEQYKLKNEELLKLKDEKEKKKLEDLRLTAKNELENWYDNYNKEKDNKFSNNRVNQEIILEIAKKTESSKEWKGVVDLCNFNSKNQSKKDVSKLKSVLMKLKESSITNSN